MTTATTTRPRRAATERAVATATTLTPVAVGVLAPFLDGSATTLLTGTYLAGAALTTANATNSLPASLTNQLPAGDIITAHKIPMFASTLTTGLALAIGSLQGPAGADALMAGILNIPAQPVPGIISLAWWLGVAFVPVKLRRVRRRRRKTTPTPTAHTPTAHTVIPPKPGQPPIPTRTDQRIAYRWRQIISNPDTGTHKRQDLTVTEVTDTSWTGTITAPTGSSVTVNADAISSAYRTRPEWITLRAGAHTGERHVTVNYQPPPELDTTTLAGAWRKWVARTGGIMAGTHLENVQTDPNTGGEVAYVVAGEDLDLLPVPDRAALAGALRTNTLLCSYNPVPGDPRKGEIRLMKHNPLKQGVPFPGRDVLKTSERGYVQIGRHVSGFPARIQFADPKLGAKHLFVAGVTGSGKGGTVQIVALADHVNGHAIIYGDPKGSSNPDIEAMACYSGLGEDGCMGALRVAYALMQWRIEESARLKMKNFVATPDRPWVRFILDEAHVPLSELVQHKKEAGIMLEALAAKARSLGIILCLVSQAVNADKLGGSTPLRTNVIQGGSLVMLRTDSDQAHLVTTGFEGIDPGQIPAAWEADRPLVYDETVAMHDPEATFGLGYTLGPGGAAEMMRTFTLESAAPYITPDTVAYPADWPDWDQRHDIAATSILGDDTAPSSSGDTDSSVLFSTLDLDMKKPATADDKVVSALESAADPLGLDITYLNKEALLKMTGLAAPTLDNALSRLVKAGRIHRQMEDGRVVRGMYGPGPAPSAEPGE
ncbi:type IV secretory system conjugative DNA transfer family protein [Streptomyces ardesiacus]|uniref:type IV secretory system conjugative DNA transfer family protein n=1 Tax=Streptomyces ardesiacus TaxID=285564 RepID=UPI003F4A16E4